MPSPPRNEVTTPPPVPGAALDGAWRLSDDALVVEFALARSGDELVGTGTYSSRSAQRIASCGGSSLPASGSVSVTATFDNPTALLRVSFGAAWSPPVYVVLDSTAHGSATFLGVDTQCGGFTLDRR